MTLGDIIDKLSQKSRALHDEARDHRQYREHQRADEATARAHAYDDAAGMLRAYVLRNPVPRGGRFGATHNGEET